MSNNQIIQKHFTDSKKAKAILIERVQRILEVINNLDSKLGGKTLEGSWGFVLTVDLAGDKILVITQPQARLNAQHGQFFTICIPAEWIHYSVWDLTKTIRKQKKAEKIVEYEKEIKERKQKLAQDKIMHQQREKYYDREEENIQELTNEYHNLMKR